MSSEPVAPEQTSEPKLVPKESKGSVEPSPVLLASAPKEPFDIVRQAVEDLDVSQKNLDLKLKDNLAALDTTFKKLDDTVNSHRAQLQQLQKVQSMLYEQEALYENSEQTAQFELLEQQLDDIAVRLDTLRASKSRTGSLFVRFWLGKVNAKVWKKAEILQLKTEYNKFKNRTTYIYLFLPLAAIFFNFRTMYL
jgi:hypothetical protein